MARPDRFELLTPRFVVWWATQGFGSVFEEWFKKFQTDNAKIKPRTEIDAVADDVNALTDHQRSELIAAIDRDRLAVQRDEEHWFTVATKSGTTLLRRPDADPRAVLGFADDMPAPSYP